MELGIDLTPGSNAVSPNLLTPSAKGKYREMIGCLMYASVMMRPDITFVVSSLSQHPRGTYDKPHACSHVCVLIPTRYKGTKTRGWRQALEDSGITQMQTGPCTSIVTQFLALQQFIGHRLISWSAKKQPIVTVV